MKITEELKDKVEKVETKEEMKDIIDESGMELNDDELDGVSGGVVHIMLNGWDALCEQCNFKEHFMAKQQADRWVLQHKSKNPSHSCKTVAVSAIAK